MKQNQFTFSIRSLLPKMCTAYYNSFFLNNPRISLLLSWSKYVADGNMYYIFS